MDSHLDPVFPLPPRQAQPSDTRQEIRRQEPHDDRRPKSGRQDDEADAFTEEDTPRVSVSSLIAFLENILSAQPDSRGFSRNEAGPPPSSPEARAPSDPALHTPAQDRAAAAAQAYRHTGDSSSARLPPPPPENTATTPVLESEDIRTIHAILPVLRDLAARGVETLILEKAARFLDCLVNAALKARDAG